MLKVVGASWEKTRFTTVMLSAVILIAVFAIFFYEVPLVENDGYYSASVLWSDKNGFREIYWGQNNDPGTVKRGVARAYYKPDMATTGWSTLEIQTQPEYPDWVQAYAAGLLEGSLCWQLIYWHWQNTVATTCRNREVFCEKIREQLEENSNNARKEAEENDNVPYWHQVHLFYTQLDGLEAGWRNGVIRSRKNKIISIPKIDFLWMNSNSDLKDLEYQYNATRKVEGYKHLMSIAFLRYSPNITNKFLLAHESAGFYSEMLRLHKCYNFGYHLNGFTNSPLTPGKKMIFSSYPAALYSRDDFYQISGESMLTISGVKIKNYNKSLWNETQFIDKIMLAPRVIAANRLSKNGEDWGKYLAKKQSGTGNKQWMVISGTDKPSDGKTDAQSISLWVIEQIPGLTIYKNQTNKLKSQELWINLGIPYYEDTLELAGYKGNQDAEEHAEFIFPVYKALSEGSAKVNDVESLTTLMRGPELTAAGRSDVVVVNVTNPNGTGDMPKVVGDSGFSVHYNYHGANKNKNEGGHHSNQIKGETGFHDYIQGMTDDKGIKDRVKSIESHHKEKTNPSTKLLSREEFISEYFGIIDLKIADGHNGYIGIAGPPFSSSFRVEPFCWSTSLSQKVPHYGQVDLWNFKPVRPEWVW